MKDEEGNYEDEDTDEQSENSGKSKTAHLAPWQFKPGVSGNPKGRKPGQSLKDFAREFLSKQTDDERLEFLKGMNKDVIWKMAEGNPKNESDVSIKELPIIQVAKEILDKNAINPQPSDNSEGQPSLSSS